MTQIPKFKTETEMQEFWATHDSADFWDDMEDEEVELNIQQRE